MNEVSRPNFVVIMSDQHNPHVMGCAGNTVVRTPNLDRLAREGVRFTSAYCPSPLCVPSRMSFMTSMFPSEVEVWDNGGMLHSDIPTFAHYLKKAGYETALCGRMHFVGADQFHGFEKRVVADLKMKDDLSPDTYGTEEARTTSQTKHAVGIAGYGKTGYRYYDTMVTKAACDYLSIHAYARQPFCLVVGLILPHNPLICDKDRFDFYYGAMPQPVLPDEKYLRSLHPAIRTWRLRRGVNDITPQHAHRALAAYYGLVSELDDNVGKIVDAVKASPQSANTALVYCSDHGDMACEHGLWWKSCFFEGSAGVPLIVSYPGSAAAGTATDSVVNLMDIGPTLSDLGGGGPMACVSGRSLRPLVEGRKTAWTQETFSEYHGQLGDLPSCMLRSEGWKMMYYHEFKDAECGPYLLFNLKDDPGELDDLRGDVRRRAIAKKMEADILGRWSAERVLKGIERKVKQTAVMTEYGCDHFPHPLPKHQVPPDENEFDRSQVIPFHS